MVGGDVSGIQSFIYDIVSSQASKNLKGRSFYLQLVVDGIVTYLLKNTVNIRTNIIYSSGGSFFIFLPNSTEIREKIQNIIIPHIQSSLYEAHSTAISVPVSFIEFSPFAGNASVSDCWKKLMDGIAELKRAPFKNMLEVKYSEFFAEAEPGGYAVHDDFNAEDLEPESAFILTSDNKVKKYSLGTSMGNDDLVLSATNVNIIRLAKELRNARYIVRTKYDGNDSFNICGLIYIRPLNEIKTSELKEGDDVLLINPGITSPSFLFDCAHIPQSYIFYGGNDYPHENGKVITEFSELAEEKKSGFARLGVLRMDVDNLGALFSSGLPSFSHYAEISYRLDLFFKYYINAAWNSQSSFKSRLNIIYSGGDDLFIIGKWNIVIHFAHMLRQKFNDYTAQSLTLSAGVAIVRPKFPVLKAALLAGEEEEHAKNHAFKGQEKNSISFMNLPLAFNSEFDFVLGLKEKFFKYLDEKILPSSFIYKLYTCLSMKKNPMHNPQQWKWLLAYHCSKDNFGLADNFVKEIMTNAILNRKDMIGYDFLDTVCFAARWAELELR
jgi:CRISPR-associated protein Csm1